MMRPASLAGVALLALVGGLIIGCRPRAPVAPVPASPAPPPLREDHCWWAVWRTPLPPDSVAARFARAFTTVGLAGPTWSSVGDTAWARGDATPLERGRRSATYAARVVAFRRVDSTLFRHYVAVASPMGKWGDNSQGIDGPNIVPFLELLCVELGKAAQTHGTAPRFPDGEEKRAVWTRYP